MIIMRVRTCIEQFLVKNSILASPDCCILIQQHRTQEVISTVHRFKSSDQKIVELFCKKRKYTHLIERTKISIILYTN